MARKSTASNVRRNIKATKSAYKKVTRAISRKRKAESRLKSKRSYTLRDLPNVKGKTFAQIATNIRANADDLNKLIKPGELWGFELGSDDHGWNKSWELFDSIDLMADKLERYETAGLVGNKSNKAGREWIEAIKIVKRGRALGPTEDDESHYQGTVEKYRKTKIGEVTKRKKKQATIIGNAAEFVVKKGKKKVASKIDIIESLLNTAKGMDKMLKDANRRIAKLERMVKASNKKAAKKPAKKATKKSTKKVGKKNVNPTKRGAKKSIKKATTKKVVKKQGRTKKVSSKKKASKVAKNKIRKATKKVRK